MRQGKSAQRFVADVGEQIDIRIEPHGAGNTYAVGGAAVRISGGGARSDAAIYRLLVGGATGSLQSVVLKFLFTEPVPPGGFSPSIWPRFDVTLSGSDGGLIRLPNVLQSSVAPTPSAQDLELLFETAAAAPAVRPAGLATPRAPAPRAAEPRAAEPAKKKTSRRKPARKKAGKKKAIRKKRARKKSARKSPRRRNKA